MPMDEATYLKRWINQLEVLINNEHFEKRLDMEKHDVRMATYDKSLAEAERRLHDIETAKEAK
ncbi:MAG: hypothetical protein EOM01_09875 [Spirochaetia bacterium]|nr:hypothetical protein [Spirochaetia bacterium]